MLFTIGYEGFRMSKKLIKVFISYRQIDNPDFVERIRDWFAWRYGQENIFMDFASIPGFTHFPDYILKKLDECNVLVAVIGPDWIKLLEEKTKKGTKDFLVEEIKYALEHDKVVAPICIKDTDEPDRNDLPVDIQAMLDYQIRPLNPQQHFLDNIERVMDEIESELEKRGHIIEEEPKPNQIWHLSTEELDKHILDLLEQNQLLTIKRYMRNFSKYFWESVSNTEETPNDELKELIEKIFVLGSVFIQYDEKDLYEEFVRLIQRLFDDVHKRTSGRYSSELEPYLWIWSEIFQKVYVIGAILLREQKYDRLSLLIKHPIEWKSEYYQGMYWMRYMHMELLNAKIIERDTVLKSSINFINEQEYYYHQFSHNEDDVIASICQFDFFQCVYVNIDSTPRYHAYPNYQLFYKSRTLPILIKVVQNLEFRHQFFGNKLTDEKLAIIIALLDKFGLQDHGRIGWFRDGYPQDILRFLENNVPLDLHTNLDKYLN